MPEISPETAEIVGNLLQILGSFISTLGSATSQMRNKAARENELAEAIRRLNTLQADLDELRGKLGAASPPSVQPRSKRRLPSP